METNKENLSIRMIRFLSRIIIKLFPITILKIISYNLPRQREYFSLGYFHYFLSSKILEREYINSLRKDDFSSAIRKKNEWAFQILKYSENDNERDVASHYLSILSKYGYVDSKYKNDLFNEDLNYKNKSSEIFYLYGPNCHNPPNLEYKNMTLVVTKDIDENTEKFKDSILFLNHIYYRTRIENNREFKDKLLDKYGKIYISSMLPIQDKEFEHSRLLPCSELCGSMALGRVLYNLILENGRFDCVIEGYDQYLESEAYSQYYPTLTRVDNLIDEQKVVQGLSDHDPLYNFLIVKELSSYINLIDSSNFRETINMTGNEYFKELLNARDFSLLP